MKIFVVDDDSEAQRRDWAALLGVEEVYYARWSDGKYKYDNRDVEKCLLVIHESSCGNEYEWEYRRNWIVENKHLALIVSAAPSTSQDICGKTNKIYRRSSPVPHGTPDEAFNKCFNRFRNDLIKNAEPKWGLVEPDEIEFISSIAILCQGYLATYASTHNAEDYCMSVKNALDQMRWGEFKNLNLITTNMSGKWDGVLKHEWWKEVLGNNQHETEKAIKDEMGGGIPGEVQELIQSIYGIGDTCVEPETVAKAFITISEKIESNVAD